MRIRISSFKGGFTTDPTKRPIKKSIERHRSSTKTCLCSIYGFTNPRFVKYCVVSCDNEDYFNACKTASYFLCSGCLISDF